LPRYQWGVDSAAPVNQSLYDCVASNYGRPDYWGRYLTTVANVSDGLTKAEVQFLLTKGVRILPIFNPFSEAVGYQKGRTAATNASFHARKLGVPTGVRIFANVEHFYSVDEGWIRGWVDGMYPTGYTAGFYHDPAKGEFSNAYCAAVAKDEKVHQQAVLWSAEPEPGVSSKQNRPKSFSPIKPPCSANVWGWQYGRDAKDCPIDTNLIDSRLYEQLWR